MRVNTRKIRVSDTRNQRHRRDSAFSGRDISCRDCTINIELGGTTRLLRAIPISPGSEPILLRPMLSERRLSMRKTTGGMTARLHSARFSSTREGSSAISSGSDGGGPPRDEAECERESERALLLAEVNK